MQRKRTTAAPPSKGDPREPGSGTVDYRQLADKTWAYRAKRQRTNPDTEEKESIVGSWRGSRLEAETDLLTLDWPDDGPREIPTFRQFWHHHMLSSGRILEASPETIGNDEVLWRTRIIESNLGRTRVDKIVKETIEDWIRDQIWRLVFVPLRDEAGRIIYEDGHAKGNILPTDKPLSIMTRKGYIGKIHLYLEAATNKPYKYIKHNPAVGIKFKRERKELRATAAKKKKAMTPQQSVAYRGGFLKITTALEEAASGKGQPKKKEPDKPKVWEFREGARFVAMQELQLNSGTRIGEVLGARWSNLIYSRGQYFFIVEAGLIEPVEGGTKLNATKTGGDRQIQISDRVADLLLKLPRRSEYIFTTKSGKPVQPHNAHRDFRKFRELIGMPNLVPHNLRKTFATLLFVDGKSVKEVQDLLGHTDSRMVMEIYTEFLRMTTPDAGNSMDRMMDRMAEVAKEMPDHSLVVLQGEKDEQEAG